MAAKKWLYIIHNADCSKCLINYDAENFMNVTSEGNFPIEDYGDYILLDEEITEKEAWDKFLVFLEEREAQ